MSATPSSFQHRKYEPFGSVSGGILPSHRQSCPGLAVDPAIEFSLSKPWQIISRGICFGICNSARRDSDTRRPSFAGKRIVPRKAMASENRETGRGGIASLVHELLRRIWHD